VATEAKYTERAYPTVGEWLGPQPTPNNVLVLEGWLNAINSVVGPVLDIGNIQDISYQMIHRTASVCLQQAEQRAVVYHCFDPSAEQAAYYSSQLRALSGLIAAPARLPFHLLLTDLKKTPGYTALQANWLATNPRADVSDAV
jgi:hypothetical protein